MEDAKVRSLDDTIGRMIDSASGTTSETNSPEFIPCSSWQGAKSGYYFGTKKQHGLGYHRDHYMGNNGNLPSINGSHHEIEKPAKRRKTGQELLEIAEKEQESNPYASRRIIQINPNGIKNSSISLSKCIEKNAMSRIKYPKKPEKFMETELALNDELESLKSVAASMDMYPNLVKTGIVKDILGLMTHDNTDISQAVISLLNEWMDVNLLVSEGINENADHMRILVSEFLGHFGIESIIGNMGRFDQSQEEEASGIDDTLTLVESLLDIDATISLNIDRSIVGTLIQSNLLSFLLEKISHRANKGMHLDPISETIKTHSAELLSAILQHEDARSKIKNFSSLSPFSQEQQKQSSSVSKKENTSTTINGIETLLLSIASYRKKDPPTESECEYLENLLDALSASLLCPDNIKPFLEAEGVELMLLNIRQKVHAGLGSLRVLYFSMSGSTSADVYKTACEYFVEKGGLKSIFPLFSGKKSYFPIPAKCSDAGKTDLSKKAAQKEQNGKVSKRAKRALAAKKEWVNKIEQYVIQIIYWMTVYLDDNSQHDAKARMVAKFLENECVSLQDLLSFHSSFSLQMINKLIFSVSFFHRKDAIEL